MLAQVPLTLSPFLSLPTSVPLPYSYKSLPSTLPPSILSPSGGSTSEQNRNDSPATQPPPQQPAYVVSASGTAASPDTILSSCVALQQHLQKLEDDARRVLGDWEQKRRAADLAEKRRVAPGWLDSGVHILKPENVAEEQTNQQPQPMDWMSQPETNKEGEELDRVFGGLKV